MRCPPPAPLAPPPPPALRRPSPPAHHPSRPKPPCSWDPSLGMLGGGVLGVAADKFSGALVLGAGRRWRGRSWSEGEGGLAGHAPDLQIPPRQPASAAADPIRQSAGSQGWLAFERGGEGTHSAAGPDRARRHTREHSPAAPAPRGAGAAAVSTAGGRPPRVQRAPLSARLNSRLFVAIARPGNQQQRG